MQNVAAIIRARKFKDAAFSAAGAILTVACLTVLGALILSLAWQGLTRIDWQFLTSFPSRHPEKAGILSAWVGSLLIMFVTGAVGVPMGIAAGVYLEEYARKNWFTNLIETNITNLAGVPSIVYGLMALGLLVYQFRLGQSILAGGITLAFLILPIVIVATRETLRSIPQHIREAAYALGASRWQVIRHHLLPYSRGGIATGVIISMSRAIGETAPLITIGALTFIAFLPPTPFSTTDAGRVVGPTEWLTSPFTVLPIQMFNWVSRPGDEFLVNAAATGVVLILATLTMNLIAIVVRFRIRRLIKW
ncbi:MAG: phosphate ABC transporter permease PstA [Phycisphaerales bacterium]